MQIIEKTSVLLKIIILSSSSQSIEYCFYVEGKFIYVNQLSPSSLILPAVQLTRRTVIYFKTERFLDKSREALSI